MKTQTIINLFTVLLFTVCLGKNPDKDIVIIYTNDVHCAVDEGIGYAGLSTYREEVKKHTPYVTLVDVGDAVQGATIGTLSHGKNIIDIMNEVKYDIAVPGNHEFDYGMEQFRYFTKYLNCEYISCNFRVSKTRKLVFNPYKIITYGDVKVAYVGISTPESFIKSDPASFMDSTGQFIFDFDGDAIGQKLYTSVQTAVNDARSHGADYVIALGHLGEFVGITSEWSAQSVVEHTSGIDAFIDGHSHEVTPSMMQKNSEGKEIPITQSGSRLEHIGQVTIGKDGSIKTELIDKNKVPSKDEKITTFIENIKSGYQPILDKVLGYANFNLTLMDETETWSLRKEETNLANFVLDAFLSEAKAYGGADIALCNSGYIRSPLSLGKITYSDALSVLPFTSESCIYDIQGQTILDALEMGARNYPVEDAGLLHTAGLTYSIDPSINSTVIVDDKNIFSRVSGQRRVYNVLVKNKPIDPNRTYRVISNTYIMRDKGDGYIFNGKKLVNTNFALPSDLLINYIRKLKVIPDVYRKPQGRLIVSSQRNVKRSFLSPIKMTFEGLTSMPFNENMNVGEVKEFPFKITLDQEIIPEDSYNITLTVQPQSTDPGVAEFVYDEETRSLKLLAKSNGKSQLAIQYSIEISIPSMNEYISLSQGLGIYTINVESNVILQERSFLSPIKMSFEGLSSLPFNENMNVGEVKEFPFKITLDQDIIPEDSYNITLTVQPQSTEPDVAEFIYDEESKTLKLLAKSNGKSQLAIQYSIDISIPSMNEYISLSHGLGIYTINVESNVILQERSFLSPIKMSFEGLSSLPFNENMNVGEVKEFPFKITLDQDIIPEDSYNITLTVQPQSTEPDVAEFIYDEESKTLKLLAKSNGKSQLAIQYSIDIFIPSMNEYISLSHGLGIYTINVESNVILQERSFLSPIKMSFEGLSSLPFNENMNVGDIKEFPFNITLDQEIIPEDSYNITLTVQPQSTEPDVAEFIYDEETKTLKLLAKSNGKSQLAIQYAIDISIPSMNEYISLSHGLGIYTINVESNTILQERLFLSPIKMSFEGLSSLPFNEDMNVGEVKEFPFNITLDQNIIPEDSYNITLTVQPESTDPDVAEFIYDEETKTLKLLAKSNGKSQLAIQYAIDISIPSMNEYISLSHGLGIYTINVESNTILQERSFLSPIKMSFEGLSSLPFNENMNVGDIKEFPFIITLDQEIIPEDSYNITLTVQPESSDPDVAEFIYDEDSKTLKLLSKSVGESQLAIQYTVEISIPSMNEYISLSKGLGIYTITVESNTLQERDNTSGGTSIGYSLKLLAIPLFVVIMLI